MEKKEPPTNHFPYPMYSHIKVSMSSTTFDTSLSHSNPMEMESVSSTAPLKIYIIPFLAPSHMIPLVEMGILFANRGQNVTIITTPSNALFLQPTLSSAIHHPISVHAIPFPSKQVGLPDGVENCMSITNFQSAAKLFQAMSLMQDDMEQFIETNPPDCIISDPYFPWTADTAIRLGIPRLAFLVSCTFIMSLVEAMRRTDSPHLSVTSDYDPFVIPGLPNPITITRAQLPDYVQKPYGYTQLIELQREAERKSYGVLVNAFYELEMAYADHYQQLMGHKVYHIGPTSLILHRTVLEKEPECLSWLNSKKPNSVIFVCFGSGCMWSDRQLTEIACGLESSGHDFIWAAKPKNADKEGSEKEKWKPPGFDERIAGRGIVVNGWAPQVTILEHPSVGGFLTHCGSSSTIESVCAGTPMATWPLRSEQFYQEKLMTQVLGIGVEVGAEDWIQAFVDDDKMKLITREKIEKAVRTLMDGESEAVMEMRRKASELKDKAKRAVEGGSSSRALTAVIEDLKQHRESRKIGHIL